MNPVTDRNEEPAPAVTTSDTDATEIEFLRMPASKDEALQAWVDGYVHSKDILSSKLFGNFNQVLLSQIWQLTAGVEMFRFAGQMFVAPIGMY